MFTIGPYPPSLTNFPVSQPVINPRMTQGRKYIRPPFCRTFAYLAAPCWRACHLHPVQLAVCCLKEVFDCSTALGIVRHADAYRKCGLLAVPCHLVANARRDDSCGRGGCLRHDDGKIADAIASNRVRKLLALSRKDPPPEGTYSAGSLIAVLIGNLPRSRRGGLPRPLNEREDVSTSGRYCSGDLVEGGVGNFKGFYLSRSLNHSGKDIGHFWVSSAVVGLRILGLIPQTDSERFCSPFADERDLVLETFLFSKQGNNLLLQPLGKLGHAIALQMQIHSTCKHESLSLVLMPKGIQITAFGQDDLKAPSVR